MNLTKSITRRSFIGKAATTASLAAMGTLGPESLFAKTSVMPQQQQRRLPREIWVTTVSQEGMSAGSAKEMTQKMLDLASTTLAYRPDVVCLPEIFMFTWINKRTTSEEKADLSDELVKDVISFARTNNCYVICPMITRENGKLYNAAVLLDRQGNRMGEYRKIHLPMDEMDVGYTPGPLQPPVFKTDFGTVGIQICYDCNWSDGWEALQRQGAEIIFWPSAYPGGRVLNARALTNRYYVVTSTRGASKICDITGDDMATTGSSQPKVICAPVNLEKICLGNWPYGKQINDMREKYGSKIKLTLFGDEGWTVLESLSPDVRVHDLLKEYNVPSNTGKMLESENRANLLRP